MKYEFIGGPLGGEWHETRGEPYMLFPQMGPVSVTCRSTGSLPPLTTSDYAYLRYEFRRQDGRHVYVYCPENKRQDGLTKQEGVVMDALCKAVVEYYKLPVDHPTEQREFVDAIHRLQDLLAVRIARRLYPKGWTTYA